MDNLKNIITVTVGICMIFGKILYNNLINNEDKISTDATNIEDKDTVVTKIDIPDTQLTHRQVTEYQTNLCKKIYPLNHIETDGLSRWLQSSIYLSSKEKAIRNMGITTINDLQYIDNETIKGIGLNPIQKNRFLKAIAQIKYINNDELSPHLAENDTVLFFKYLDNARNYFEYGSGGSTYAASKRSNIKSIYSVESDIDWHRKLKSIINHNNIHFIFCNMDTKINTWGYPSINSTRKDWINYSGRIEKLDESIGSNIDLIFIDGRFRVACCLKCFRVMNDNCLIAFDDFLNRREYYIVLDFYNIIEYTDDHRMVILKKKDCEPPNIALIHKYEMNLY